MLASSYNARIHPQLVRDQVADTGAYVRPRWRACASRDRRS